jgi:hypothetical protein
MSEPEQQQRVSLTTVVQAPASAVFAIVSDPAGHVLIDGSGMLVAAPDAKKLTAVGDTFDMDMDREPLGDVPEMGKYQVRNTVTAIEPDALIEWNVGTTGRTPIGHVYGYQLVDAGDGATEVTSYCDWSGLSEKMAARIPHWPIVPASMLEKSLENLKREAEKG